MNVSNYFLIGAFFCMLMAGFGQPDFTRVFEACALIFTVALIYMGVRIWITGVDENEL